MARALEVALAVERAVAERALGLALRGGERLLQLVRGAHDAHPATAATRRRLDEEREADLLGRAVGQDGNAGLARDPLGCELVPAEPKRLRRRADPGQPGRLDRFGEVRVFGEEAVAGMDRVGPALPRGADVLLGVEVRARSRRARRPSARGANPRRPAQRRPPSRSRAHGMCERRGARSRPCSQRGVFRRAQGGSLPACRSACGQALRPHPPACARRRGQQAVLRRSPRAAGTRDRARRETAGSRPTSSS